MIDVTSLQVRSGSFTLDVDDLRVAGGAYVVLMGPTGCGKTTLLEAIAGLRPINRGAIRLGGVDVSGHRPCDRQVGYVPQDGVLFPTLSVRDNLAFALRLRRMPRAERERRIAELADMLGIEPLLDRSTRRLSGGERQRVALGRALATGTDILLLDEPFSALDAATRRQMHELIARIRTQTRFTALHVTHQAEDAAALADVVLGMRDGRLTSRAAARTPTDAHRWEPTGLAARLAWRPLDG